MWQFQQICTIALENLPYRSVEKSPTEKVALAFQYDIKHWLLPGLNQLAQRSEPINVADVQLLGLEVALKIAAVRESLVFDPTPTPGVESSINGCRRINISGHRPTPQRPRLPTPQSPRPPTPSPVDHITSTTRNTSDVDFTPTIKQIFELSGAEFNSDPFVSWLGQWKLGKFNWNL